MLTAFGMTTRNGKRLFTWFLAVTLLLSVIPISKASADAPKLYTEVPSEARLVSQGAPVTAYNGMEIHDGPQSNLTDGDLTTLSGGALGFVDLYLDLGQKMGLDYVKINFNRHWTGVNTIYVSDDATNWTEVVSGDGSLGKYEYLQNTTITDILKNNIFGALLPSNTSGRYVRIRAQQDYVNINEIQVYSQDAPPVVVSKQYTEVPSGARLVSQGAPVTAYNNMEIHDGPQSNLTDGDLTTLSGGALGFVDLYLDLGQKLSFDYVKVFFTRLWNGTNTIYVSDDAQNWTEVITGNGSIGKYEYLKDTTATDAINQTNILGALLPAHTAGRYVRLRAQQDYVNMYEIQVYSSQSVPLEHLKVEGSSTMSVVQGFSMQMNVKAQPELASDKSVTWSVVPKAGSTGVASIDAATGLLTAITAGIVTVKATANDGSGIMDSADVSINPSVEQWREMEFSLVSSKTYNNPFMDVDVTASFTGPNGEILTRPAFWDGGETWKVRFSPTTVGEWSVTTQATDSTDTGLNSSTPISFNSVEYKGTLDIYKRGFLKISDTKRYFSYNDGTPFFYLGDTHWFMPSEDFDASNVDGIDSQFKYAADHRVSQGYTVYQSEPLYTNGNYLDVSHGIVPTHLARLQDMDRKFQYIADAGLVHANAALTFRSLLNVTDPITIEKLGKYWQARFGAFPVLWTTAQEVDPGNDVNPYWHMVAKAIYDSDAYHRPLTAHMEGGDALHSGWGDKYYHSWFAVQPSNLQKDGYQTFWDYAIKQPYVAYETGYEFNRTTTDVARSTPYRAFSNGAFGFGYGVQGVWALSDSPDNWFPYGPYYRWFDGLNALGGFQMTYFKNFYESLQWWNLTPTFRDTTYADFTGKDLSYLLIDGNKTYIAYFAETNKTTGTLKQMENTVYKAEWYNTRTGQYTLISDQVTPVNGQWVIPQKPDNLDWILLVTSSQSALSPKLVVSSANQATTINTQHATLQMSAVINVEHTPAQVSWKVTQVDGSATDLATIDQNGLLTSLKNGNVLVTATTGNGLLTASKTVILTRKDKANPPEKAQSLTVVDGGEKFAGNKQFLTYFSPSNTWDQRVDWAVYESDGVTPTDKAMISPFGIITLLKEGNVKIVATAMDGSGVKGSYDYPIHFDITNPLLVGADATASSSDYGNDYTPAKAILSKHGAFEGWSSSAEIPTSYDKPDWLQVKFAQPTVLNHIEVFTTGYGYNMKDFDVQYWDGSKWTNLYSVKGNTKDVIKVLFPEITTTQIRVICYKGDAGGISRIDSIEVYKDPKSHDASLSGISVGGKVINGFTPGTKSYQVVLPAGTSAAPTVTAAVNDSHANVTITQAAALPGTAVINVTAEDGETTVVYEVKFTVATSPPATTPSTSTPTTPKQGKSGSVNVEAKVDSSGIAAVDVKAADLQDAIEHAVNGIVTINVLGTKEADKVTVTIPAQQFRTGTGTQIELLIVDTGLAVLSIKAEALGGWIDADSQYIQLSVSKTDTPEQVKQQIGSHVVYDFSLSIDGKPISEFKGNSIKVSRDYTLQPGEDPYTIVVYYIDDNGKLEVVKNGLYNSATGRMEFSPKHFSKYVIANNQVNFSDVAAVVWAKNSIHALAARGVIAGNGSGQFKPNDHVTRAEFLKMLMESLDLVDGKDTSSFSDVKKGSWYYSSIAAAQKLGIVKGKNDGSFGVNEPITRQDMAVIVYKAAQVVKAKLNGGSNGVPFTDQGDISTYASEAVLAIQKAGIINGLDNGSFAPKSQATRAQAAVMIYKLFTLIS
ncbi:hypothetical protein Back11_05000 [Paenibacillus baekrokdamisoli]|uniref:Uncharacterized protein n=2 Tax=Paenibacillus baekrokdamisoli TaxID=1712516 RepID=A0A3G9ISZ8_9BACL|nr:S-layer homology domain-containing protein [Paenibacillus baekrokdamisoli]MBB3067659.1 hypothetical protein [Paenibacillus baekrokdamisoli]BBH19155.1 hypothetical protein Back11_05000 [Paenibacillus baekrokdamisoli]